MWFDLSTTFQSVKSTNISSSSAPGSASLMLPLHYEYYAAAGEHQLNPLFLFKVCQGSRWDSFPTVWQTDPAHNDAFARSNIKLGGKRQVEGHCAPRVHCHTRWVWAKTTPLSAWNPWFTDITMWIDKTTRGWVEGFVLWPKFGRTEGAAGSFSQYFFCCLLFWFLNLSSVKSSKIFTRNIL